ncbi:hypothetical protein K7402_15420 [Pseudomonas fluorescens group sp.]|uniref:Uncharacterized protein n=1 Tax=Pseudomonas fluorescens TaxID=294 RepID=A0ACD4XNC3_PSEFL|nr:MULTISPECIES: hypothetical protein [Pseudomonas fluorescens group]MBZ6456693.1 hypothetical protein [Pseudomonas fluorescens group sp.]MBZ6462640.1 hypothetical protein [Pseudomonas fluorescens group sp.]MBZ6468781.1 hypothetical protein [Pseudomonas fluorescens group sp.]WQD70458.1 hypothetical protein U0037_20625 [Pseudomonas marginalis]
MNAIPEYKVHPEFSDVYIAETKASFADGYDPIFDSDLASLSLRSLVSVSRSQTIVSKIDGTGRFRIFFDFGARWSKVDNDSEPEPEPEPQVTVDSNEDDALIVIECGIVAEFLLSKRYEQTDLDNFALSEAVNYVIPYWKNYLISQCGLMRLQDLVLPDGDNK